MLDYASYANTQPSPWHALHSRVLCNFHPRQCPIWHRHVIHIAPIHLTLLFYSSVTFCCSVMLDLCLPRAELCCFSANHDRCTGTARRSDGPRRCNRARMNFNTLRETVFLCLPRKYRISEKFDPIARFSGPDRRKS